MDAQLKETSSVRREVSFSLSAEEFSPHRDERLREIRKKAKIKGYRPGTAPMSLVSKLYGESVGQEAAEEAMQKAFVDYAKEHDLQPYGTPMATEIEMREDGGIDFTIAYDVLPEFELGEYRGLSAQKIYHAVTPEEIDAELSWLRDQHKNEETVDTVADENHTAVVDFQKLDDSGAPLIGEVSRDVPVNLASEHINDELKETLIGMRLDQTARIELPTGENEENVPYEMTIKDIRQVTLPEVDDAFAQKITQDEEADVEDLRDTIKQSIEAQYEAQFQRMYRDQLVDRLVDAHDFEVPNALVGRLLNDFLEDQKREMKVKELPETFPIAEFIEERTPQATRVAKWLLIRDKIVEAEDLMATPEDYEALAEIDSQRIGVEPEKLLKYYEENEEVEQRIISEKVLQLLADYSEVDEEIEDVEWRRQREAAEAAANPEAAVTTEEAGESSEETNQEGSTDDVEGAEEQAEVVASGEEAGAEAEAESGTDAGAEAEQRDGTAG